MENQFAVGLPALVITPEKPALVGGNFAEVEAKLNQWKESLAAVEMTEDNMEGVRVVKKQAVAYRNQLNEVLKSVKKIFFNDPKAVFEAKMNALLAVVGEVENKADEVLSIEEQQRIAEVNLVLDNYKEKFQEVYQLSDRYLARVEYKKTYYNKTADEKTRKDDLEAQFKTLSQEQTAYNGNVGLIKTVIAGDQRLNENLYIEMLERLDVASIVSRINEEKTRLNGISPAPTSTVQPQAVQAPVVEEKKTVIGVPSNIDLKSDFPGVTKKLKVEIEYPADLGESLTEVFKYLRQFGIKTKPIRDEVVF